MFNGLVKKVKKIVENGFFKSFILLCIFLNSVLIVFQTNPKYQNNSTVNIIDRCFLVIFWIEIILRMIADNKNFLRSRWNIFDTLIVLSSSLLEVSSLRILRTFRIIRLFSTARVAKTFRIVRFISKSDNLQRIVISISRALPKILSTGFLLIIVYFIYAVLGVSIYNKPDCPYCEEFFGSLSRAVHTLFQVMTEDSWASSIARVVDATHPSIWIYFISFIIVTTLTILSVITGVIVESITETSKEFDKGKVYYNHSDHVIILGFNEISLYILEQLNRYESNVAGIMSRRNVLILHNGDIDRVKIQVDSTLHNTAFLNITYIKGNPSSADDLKKCNIPSAKSIILSNSDSINTVKSILGIKMILENLEEEKEKPHIIAAVRDQENYASLKKAFPDTSERNNNIHILSSQEIVSKVLAHTCRKFGFADIFNELFTPDNNEIYIHPFKKSLYKKSFYTACFSYEKCILMGYVKENQEICLNPDPASLIPENSRGIFLSEKERFINYKSTGEKTFVPKERNPIEFKKKDFTFIGCNKFTHMILQELDHYVGKDSNVKIYSTQKDTSSIVHFAEEKLKNLKVEWFHKTKTEISKEIDHLKEDKASVIIFLTEDVSTVEEADGILMTNLLSAMNTLESTGKTKRILCEMKKIENQTIAPKRKDNAYLKGLEYVVGNRITCQILTQIALNPELDAIYKEILNEYGSEFYMKKPSEYGLFGEQTVNNIIDAALQRNEVFIGYMTNTDQFKLNPDRKKKINLDEVSDLIVLAEN